MAKRIGLALTGGSLRGVCAQTGVLKALQEENIEFDVLIGSSAGAIVGALYAGGLEPDEIERRLRALRRRDYIDPDLDGTVNAMGHKLKGWHGLLRGEALLEWLRERLPAHNRLEKTERKLYLTVTNVSRGEAQVKSRGPLAEFVRASAALPLVYRLQEVEGDLYADGGILNNVPVDALVEAEAAEGRRVDCIAVVTTLNVDPEVAVSDNGFLGQEFTPGHVLGRFFDALERHIKRGNLDAGGSPVFTIKARVPELGLFEPEGIRSCIETAYRSVKQQLRDGTLDLAPLRAEAAAGGFIP